MKILDVSFNSFTSGCATHYLNDASKTTLTPAEKEKKEKEEAKVSKKKTHKLINVNNDALASIYAQGNSETKYFKCSRAAWKWRRAFQQNKTLLHADFCFNQINPPDIRCIGDGLKDNHTLFGLHIANGNGGQID